MVSHPVETAKGLGKLVAVGVVVYGGSSTMTPEASLAMFDSAFGTDLTSTHEEGIKKGIADTWDQKVANGTAAERGEVVGQLTAAVAEVVVGTKGAGAAAKMGRRSLDDLSSLRGSTWEEAESLIPKDWIKGVMKKGEGVKFINPAKKGEQILLEKGWQGAKDLLHAGPYMKVSRNGQVTRIPLSGNPTLK